MNSKQVAATLAGVALVGLVAVAPWYLGRQAERAYGNQLATLEHQPQGWRVIQQDYQRGWFTSTASADLTPSTGALAEALRVHIDSRIAHGPRGLSDLTWPPTLAHVESVLTLEHPAAQLSGVHAQTRIGWNGSALVDLDLPALDQAATTDRPGLRTGAGKVVLNLDRSASIGARVALPSLDVLDANGQTLFSLRDLHATNSTVPWLAGLRLGTGELTIAEVQAQGPELEIQARDLRVAVQSSQQDGLLDLAVNYSVGELRIGGSDYAPAQVDIRITGLGGDALAALQRDIDALSVQNLPEAMADIARLAVLMKHLPELAATDPQIALERLDIATPQGPVRGHLTLGVQGLTAADLTGKQTWVRRLTSDGELSLPRGVALTMVARGLLRKAQGATDQGQTPAQEQAAADAATSAAKAQLDALIQDGWIEAEGDRLKSSIKLADGLLTINGKTLPIGTTQTR